VTFEWARHKAASNIKKHRVAFEDAAMVFIDPLAMTFPDPDHGVEEGREITIGSTMGAQVLFVSHCQRGERIRIISARLATRSEREQYEEGIEG
jgi:uncharacterized protein